MSTTAEAARKSWLRRLSIGQITAIVGLVSGIVTLLFVFKPGWKPQAPPDVGKLTVSDVDVARPVRFSRYLERVGTNGPNTFTKEYLRRKGALVSFQFDASGFRGKTLPIHYELVDVAEDETVVSNDAYGIIPSTNNESRKWFVWSPVPRTRKEYAIIVTIYQPQKQRIALADFRTKPFPGLKMQ